MNRDHIVHANRMTTIVFGLLYYRSGEQISLQCIDQHPNQPHVAVTGSHDGSIIIWDLRQDRYPAVVLKAHLSTGNELK